MVNNTYDVLLILLDLLSVDYSFAMSFNSPMPLEPTIVDISHLTCCYEYFILQKACVSFISTMGAVCGSTIFICSGHATLPFQSILNMVVFNILNISGIIAQKLVCEQMSVS
jgi:hypothetical protein